MQKEKELTQLKSDIRTYMDMLSQVLKHFKTLLKYLHGQVQTTKDPTVIEQTNRQIRQIEKLKIDVKMSMRIQTKRLPKNRETLENMVCLSASEENFEVPNNNSHGGRLSIESATFTPMVNQSKQASLKDSTNNQSRHSSSHSKANGLKMEARESLHEIQNNLNE